MDYNGKSNRAFRYERQKATVASKVKAQMAEYQLREATRTAEVEALEAMQASRPLRPPGVPGVTWRAFGGVPERWSKP